MPRTTAYAVHAIRPSARDPLPYIMTATGLVDHYLGTSGYSTAWLTEIETWWTCHLMEVAEPRATSTKLGDTTVTYGRTDVGMGLEATLYGQQVLTMDPKGLLAAQTATKQAVFDVF